MHYIKSFLLYLLVAIGSLAIILTLLSLINHVNIWWIKVLDFPRQQVFITTLLCLLLSALLIRRWSFWPALLVAGLLIAAGLQVYYLLPYTPLVTPKVAQTRSDQLDEKSTVSIMVANVYMKNRQAQDFLALSRSVKPDIMLVMETDRWWENALQALDSIYPYSLQYPLDNTYGMMLYSRYPLIEPEIKFLQHEDVPSFHTRIRLATGALFYFHGVHPVPPTRSKYPDNIGRKEEELLEVGQMIAAHQMPAIVAGDLNDVAWSHTSRLFQTESKLSDLRIGRGFYNSFNAHSRLMRWPLDHVYVTEEFNLLEMKRLGKFGSDHFPLYVKLALTP